MKKSLELLVKVAGALTEIAPAALKIVSEVQTVYDDIKNPDEDS